MCMVRSKLNPVTVQAVAAHQAGLIAVADMAARTALKQNPNDATARNLLGRTALDIGAPDVAVEHFSAALEIDRAFKSAEKNLRHAEQLLTESAPAHDAERYVLIKPWGAGFWSDVDHVLGGLLLAEITQRTPIVHWGEGSRYTDDSSRDAFTTFFKPVSPRSIDDVIDRSFDYFPRKWCDDNLHATDNNKWHGDGSRFHLMLALRRSERVIVSDFHSGLVTLLPWMPRGHRLHGLSPAEVYRDLISRYLQPTDEIVRHIDTFYEQHMSGREWIAVHLRGSDKIVETPALPRIHASYPAAIARVMQRHPNAGIFLLTEDARAVDAMNKLYPGRVLITPSTRTSNQYAPHTMKGANVSRHQLGVDVMLDTYLAARCNAFVGMGSSNVSCMVMHLGRWSQGSCLMLDPILHYQSHISLYDPAQGIGGPAPV